MTEITSVLASDITFTAFHQAVSIPLPTANWDLLEDIKLAIMGQPSAFSPGCVQDVHVYLNNYDLTPYIINQLRALLNDPAKAKSLRDQYHRAIDEWLSLSSEIGDAYSISLDRERSAAEHLKKQKHLGSLIDRLGNSDVGWEGNLHVFNYLYRRISVERISIASALNDYSRAHPQPNVPNLKDVSNATIVFSAGPRETQSWPADKAFSLGTMAFQMELIYTNPLEDSVLQILAQVGQDGVLDLATKGLLKRIEAISQRVQKCEDTVGDANTLKGLQSTLQELKKHFGIP